MTDTFGPGQEIAMIAIADLSALLPPANNVGITKDGGYALDNGATGMWTQAVRLYDQAPINFTTPYVKFWGRNWIPEVVFDHQSGRFCGQSARPAFGPHEYTIMMGDGRPWHIPVFGGSSGFVVNTEIINNVVPAVGEFWGIIDVNSTRDGTQVFSETMNSAAQVLNYQWQIGGGTFDSSMVVGENYFQCLDSGTADQLVNWYSAVDFLGGRNSPPEFVRAFQTDFPKFGAPIRTNQMVEQTPVSPWLDQGTFHNYTFQQAVDDVIVIAATGGQGSGTTIDFNTGKTDYSQTNNPPTFDLQVNALSYTPLFPTAPFQLGGKTYSFNGQNGTLRNMTMIGGMLFAIVNMAEPSNGGPGSHVLFVSGITIPFANLTLFEYDTLNWKRSLTYGRAGPG